VSENELDDFDSHYLELGLHLNPLRPVFSTFCDKHGFETKRTGRYPEIHVFQEDDCSRWFWFILGMSWDENGMYRKRFFEEVPYFLSAGVCYYEEKSPTLTIRHGYSYSIWNDIPFCTITKEMLQVTLEEYLIKMKSISLEQLLAEGEIYEIRTTASLQ